MDGWLDQLGAAGYTPETLLDLVTAAAQSRPRTARPGCRPGSWPPWPPTPSDPTAGSPR